MARARTEADVDPDRFVAAQAQVWPGPLDEIRAGRKVSHWMWFVFPQLATLGRSDTARYYGLAGVDEAAAYLAHPVLGPRLVAISTALLAHRGTPAETILGKVDALKLRSSMTLFERVPGAPPVFGAVLDAFHSGERCPTTRAETAG